MLTQSSGIKKSSVSFSLFPFRFLFPFAKPNSWSSPCNASKVASQKQWSLFFYCLCLVTLVLFRTKRFALCSRSYCPVILTISSSCKTFFRFCFAFTAFSISPRQWRWTSHPFPQPTASFCFGFSKSWRTIRRISLYSCKLHPLFLNCWDKNWSRVGKGDEAVVWKTRAAVQLPGAADSQLRCMQLGSWSSVLRARTCRDTAQLFLTLIGAIGEQI